MNKTWQPSMGSRSPRCRTRSNRLPMRSPFTLSSNAPRNASSPTVQYVSGLSASLKASGGHSTNWAKWNKNAAFTSYSPVALDSASTVGGTPEAVTSKTANKSARGPFALKRAPGPTRFVLRFRDAFLIKSLRVPDHRVNFLRAPHSADRDAYIPRGLAETTLAGKPLRELGGTRKRAPESLHLKSPCQFQVCCALDL